MIDADLPPIEIEAPISLARELPRRTVRLSSFYIDKYEVTNGQYGRFLDWIKQNSKELKPCQDLFIYVTGHGYNNFTSGILINGRPTSGAAIGGILISDRPTSFMASSGRLTIATANSARRASVAAIDGAAIVGTPVLAIQGTAPRTGSPIIRDRGSRRAGRAPRCGGSGATGAPILGSAGQRSARR